MEDETTFGAELYRKSYAEAVRNGGGFSAKIRMAVDKRGKPLRFILTGGERNDITQSGKLIEGLEGEYVIADK